MKLTKNHLPVQILYKGLKPVYNISVLTRFTSWCYNNPLFNDGVYLHEDGWKRVNTEVNYYAYGVCLRRQ